LAGDLAKPLRATEILISFKDGLQVTDGLKVEHGRSGVNPLHPLDTMLPQVHATKHEIP